MIPAVTKLIGIPFHASPIFADSKRSRMLLNANITRPNPSAVPNAVNPAVVNPLRNVISGE